MEILITCSHGEDALSGLPLARLAQFVLEREGKPVNTEVSISFVDNEKIAELNERFRGIEGPTDVLSFPMFELTPGVVPTMEDVEADPETSLVPLGDMVLSVERAQAQGEEYGHGSERELAYLAVHSILHLLGYDHLDEGPMKAQMRAREEAILSKLGITREQAWRDTAEI